MAYQRVIEVDDDFNDSDLAGMWPEDEELQMAEEIAQVDDTIDLTMNHQDASALSTMVSQAIQSPTDLVFDNSNLPVDTTAPLTQVYGPRYVIPDLPSGEKPVEFTRFQRVPAEIRANIYNLALDDIGPRTIQMLQGDPDHVFAITLGTGTDYLEVIVRSIPLTLVNVEAREVALKRYTPVPIWFESHEPGRFRGRDVVIKTKGMQKFIYIDFAIDRLLFRPANTFDMESLLYRMDLAHLKSIVVSVDYDLPDEWRRVKRVIEICLRYLPSLTHFEITLGNTSFDINYPPRAILAKADEKLLNLLYDRIFDQDNYIHYMEQSLLADYKEQIEQLNNCYHEVLGTMKAEKKAFKDVTVKFSIPVFSCRFDDGRKAQCIRLLQSAPRNIYNHIIGAPFLWCIPVGEEKESNPGEVQLWI